MSQERPDDDAIGSVRADRRAFVKGIVGVAAFSAPMIASYDLESLSSSVASAQSNQTNPSGLVFFKSEQKGARQR